MVSHFCALHWCDSQIQASVLMNYYKRCLLRTPFGVYYWRVSLNLSSVTLSNYKGCNWLSPLGQMMLKNYWNHIGHVSLISYVWICWIHGCLISCIDPQIDKHCSEREKKYSYIKIKLENGRSTPGYLTVQSAMRQSLLRRLFAHWWNKYASCM